MPPEWRPIVPVPPDAPDAPAGHPQFGRPGSVDVWRSEAYALFGYCADFDTPDGKKLLPLLYGQDTVTDQRSWRWCDGMPGDELVPFFSEKFGGAPPVVERLPEFAASLAWRAPPAGPGPTDAEDGDDPHQFETGSDVEIARVLAAELRNEYGGGHVVFAEGGFWGWKLEQKHWTKLDEHALELRIHDFDGAPVIGATGNDRKLRINNNRVEGALKRLRAVLAAPGFFGDAPEGINCLSGFIVFDVAGAPRLEPHSPDHKQYHLVAGTWPAQVSEETARSSLLSKLLAGCFAGDADAEAKQQLLAEVAAAAALGRGTRGTNPKAVILEGKSAGNGKSQAIDVIGGLLPYQAISAVPVSRLDDEQRLVHLHGALLNVAGEIANQKAVESSSFKSVVTGDELTAKEVFKPPFKFRPRAQHVFATNGLPSFTGGIDQGVRRRLIILVFNRVIPPDERVENIGRRIAAEEPDLLLDWIVQAASSLIRRGSFLEPESSREALAEWIGSSDPVAAWLNSPAVYFGGDAVVRSGVAHGAFKRWAIAEGYSAAALPAVNNFSTRVRSARRDVVRASRRDGNYFLGMHPIEETADG